MYDVSSHHRMQIYDINFLIPWSISRQSTRIWSFILLSETDQKVKEDIVNSSDIREKSTYEKKKKLFTLSSLDPNHLFSSFRNVNFCSLIVTSIHDRDLIFDIDVPVVLLN